MSTAAVQKIREANNRQLKAWYSWQLHVFANIFILLAAAVAISKLGPLSISDAAILVPAVVLWSVIEYAIHRFILHGRLFSRLRFHREHSVFHHGYFTDREMSLERPVDVNRILLFTIDLVTVILLDALISFSLSLVIGQKNGLLFFVAGVIYIALYETVHALCHLEFSRGFKVLSPFIRHHEKHHDPKVMARSNFAIVFPFVDSLFLTKESK